MISRRDFLGGVATFAAAGGLQSRPAAAGDPFVVLTARPDEAPLAEGLQGAGKTRIWGYNGSVPGPILRYRRGDRVRVRLKNELPQPTSIHWHGIRVVNAMDGVPGLTQPAVLPGESFDYDFVVPDAGTFWYHTHARTWEQLARGLYGLLIVDEDEPPVFDRDIALALDDWRLTEDGQIEEESLGSVHDRAHLGRLGNWLTVNGRSRPEITVARGERIRLRLANTANARILELAFPDHSPMLAALDGSPVPLQPLNGSPLILAPGQRADLVFHLKGQAGARYPLHEVSQEQPLEFAYFAYAEEEMRDLGSLAPIASFPPAKHPPLDLSSAVTADLVMTGGAMGRLDGAMHGGVMRSMKELAAKGIVWAMNGVAADPDHSNDPPLVEVARDTTVIIDMVNDTRWPHAMHLHGHHFRVIRRDGRAIDSAPWRDTELVAPDERVAIAFVADNPGKWLFHCHMVEHHAAGMATWINVTA